ncbi:pulmonary surfactant-associated C-like [Pelobates cultripes]|nr:pulmonary surfactant-associated C-like [Pelobates cultripes]
MNDKRKTCIWSLVVLTLLAIIVVGATLVGVYMTQKHTEAVVEMAFNAKSGERVHQRVMVNDLEKIAAFYVTSNNISSTILYDYNHEIIGLRRIKGAKCFIINMDRVNVPTMEDILRGIKRFQRQNSTADTDLTYSITEGEEAQRTELGTAINLLCSDVPIYWATPSQSSHLRWILTINFNIFGFEVSVKFES